MLMGTWYYFVNNQLGVASYLQGHSQHRDALEHRIRMSWTDHVQTHWRAHGTASEPGADEGPDRSRKELRILSVKLS
jgi:hypothetical protein